MLFAILTDIAQVNALAKLLQTTKAAVGAEVTGFEVGTSTIVDVLNAQRDIYVAQLSYERTRYLYSVDQLRLKNAAGIPSAKDLAGLLTLEPAVNRRRVQIYSTMVAHVR